MAMTMKQLGMKKLETGDYTSKPVRKGARMVDTRKKQLINLPDEQKAWIMKVVELALNSGQDCNQTAVIRALVGSAMAENPEAFVAKLQHLTLKTRLDDIERKAAALEAEKARLREALSRSGSQLATSSRE